MLPLGLFFGHIIKSWVRRMILKNPSVQVYIYSLLSSDYHHSRMDHSTTVWLITLVKNPELLVGGICGGLGRSRGPFLLQGLLVVLPKFSLQLLSVVKEVHQLNLHQEKCKNVKIPNWHRLPSPMDATSPMPSRGCCPPLSDTSEVHQTVHHVLHSDLLSIKMAFYSP